VAKDQDKLAQILKQLAEQARLDSIGSIDYLTNAKAIALANEQVQEAIREVLKRGMRLTEIRPMRGFGSGLMSFPIQITFRSGTGEGSIDLETESLVVTVEIPTRSVKRVAAGPAGGEGAAGDIPFSIAATAHAPYRGAPLSELQGRTMRERAFYADLGFPVGAGRPSAGQWTIDDYKTSDTPTGTETGSTSYSDGVADDSEVDDSASDEPVIDDHITEGHPGDPNFWSPFDPGRPFGGDLPRPGGRPGTGPRPDPRGGANPRRSGR
jgi:hypothetical protein